MIGYGLSYTTYEYDNFKVTTDENNIYASVDITNTGNVEGQEIVQLYMWDMVASKVHPVKELKDFEKINLKSKETKQVRFTLSKSEIGFHKFINNELKYIREPGRFKIMVGTNSEEYLETKIQIKGE